MSRVNRNQDLERLREVADILGPEFNLSNVAALPPMTPVEQARARFVDSTAAIQSEIERQGRGGLTAAQRADIYSKEDDPARAEAIIRAAEYRDEAQSPTTARQRARLYNEGVAIKRRMVEQAPYAERGNLQLQLMDMDPVSLAEMQRRGTSRPVVPAKKKEPKWQSMGNFQVDLSSYNPSTKDYDVKVDVSSLMPNEVKTYERPDGVYAVTVAPDGTTKAQRVGGIPPAITPHTVTRQGKDGPEEFTYYIGADGKPVEIMTNKSADKDSRPMYVRDAQGFARLIDMKTGKARYATGEDGQQVKVKDNTVPSVRDVKMRVPVGTTDDGAGGSKPVYEDLLLSQVTEFDESGKPTRAYAIATEDSIKRLTAIADRAEQKGDKTTAEQIRSQIAAYSPSAIAAPSNPDREAAAKASDEATKALQEMAAWAAEMSDDELLAKFKANPRNSILRSEIEKRDKAEQEQTGTK